MENLIRSKLNEISLPLTLRSLGPEETKTIGRKLGKLLRSGEVVCLYGELGAGKTCLVQGLAQGLKVREEEIKSPTFVLIREYEGELPVYHFDLFRLSNSQELEELGYEEYFYGRGVTLIEWADRLGECLPSRRIDINLSIIGEQERHIEVSSPEGLSDQIVEGLAEA